MRSGASAALAAAGLLALAAFAHAAPPRRPPPPIAIVTPPAVPGDDGEWPDRDPAFRKCLACHLARPGNANGLGPNLYEVWGRAAASDPTFVYSAAMKRSTLVWTRAALDSYLADPGGSVPGGKAHPRFANAGERKRAIEVLARIPPPLTFVVVTPTLPTIPPAPPPEASAEHRDPALIAARAPIFRKCAACHNAEAGAPNGVGPNLYGAYGRRAAAVSNYRYSPALRASGLSWDEKTLDRWLAGPRHLVPDTKMTFAGLSRAEDRQAAIAFLRERSPRP